MAYADEQPYEKVSNLDFVKVGGTDVDMIVVSVDIIGEREHLIDEIMTKGTVIFIVVVAVHSVIV